MVQKWTPLLTIPGPVRVQTLWPKTAQAQPRWLPKQNPKEVKIAKRLVLRHTHLAAPIDVTLEHKNSQRSPRGSKTAPNTHPKSLQRWGLRPMGRMLSAWPPASIAGAVCDSSAQALRFLPLKHDHCACKAVPASHHTHEATDLLRPMGGKE